VVKAKTGEVVIFFNPDEEIDILAAMKAGNTALSRGYNTIFADHLFDSNYSLYAAVYSRESLASASLDAAPRCPAHRRTAD
jgi:hypothetical protein